MYGVTMRNMLQFLLECEIWYELRELRELGLSSEEQAGYLEYYIDRFVKEMKTTGNSAHPNARTN